MVNVTQREFKQFISEDTGSICKSEQAVVRENRPEAHSTGMNDSLLAKIAKTCMAVDDLNSLSKDDITEDRKEREDRRECRLSIYD